MPTGTPHPGRPEFAALREGLGINQTTAAKRAKVSRSTIYRLESGIGAPHLEDREDIARAYGITLGEFNELLMTPPPIATDSDIADSGEAGPGPGQRENATKRREAMIAGLGVVADVTLGLSHFSSAAQCWDEGPPHQERDEERAQTAPTPLIMSLLSPRADKLTERYLQLEHLRPALQEAKADYRACEHRHAAERLQQLIPRAEAGESLAAARERQRWAELVAETYQLTTSILLRFGAPGLALVAAGRSAEAAERSQNSSRIGASTRVLTHALMRSAESEAGKALAVKKAKQLERANPADNDPTLWSIRGALLLRAAEAAAESGSISDAYALLDESSQLAERVGQGADHGDTAFNPANVLAHHVAIELALRNAGRALDAAQKINLSQLASLERQVTVQLDIARSYTQWGKYEHATTALWAVEKAAPEELRLRKGAHAMIRQIQYLAPPTVSPAINTLSARIGLGINP